MFIRHIAHWLFLWTLWVQLPVGAQPAAGAARPPRPDEPGFATYVMTRMDDLYRGKSSHGIMEMVVSTRHWKRSMALEAWSLDKDYSLIRILAPQKEKGSATLKSGEDLFSYLNKTGRTIKLSSGMMGGSWMGSHFTNDDLVRESRFDRDYEVRYTGSRKLGDAELYDFALVPRPRAAVVWGKITVSVRAADLLPTEQVFYDEDGRKVRQLDFSDYQQVSGRLIPTTMTMRPLDDSGEFTRVSWKKLSFDLQLTPDFFSLQRLKTL